MSRSFLLFATILCSFHLPAQPVEIPAEAQTFLLNGHDVLDYIAGDLNGDKKPDAIMILKQPGEDTAFGEELARPFLILIRQADGKLKRVVKNDKVILCRSCGGVFGDPYEGVTITPKGFDLSFYGGSNWRWSYQYQFVYKPNRKSWLLAKEIQVSTWTVDPENNTKETVIPANELGEIPIEKFDNSPAPPESEWKVKAVKTYFYDNPALGSKPRKGYLLKGNKLTGTRHLSNFIEVSFENKSGEFTNGFILKKDLERIK